MSYSGVNKVRKKLCSFYGTSTSLRIVYKYTRPADQSFLRKSGEILIPNSTFYVDELLEGPTAGILDLFKATKGRS